MITVKRRLAIANLSPKIRQAYRAEEIDGETLRALTLASKQQQKDWLALFEDSEQGAPRGSNLKRWLLGGSQISTKNAIFDLATYKGEIVSDLFGEESYFANPDTFWTLQNEAIAKLKASFEGNGWTRVEIMEQDQRFHEWDYEKTSKKKGGAVFISVSERGEVEVHEGYLSRAEARKREAKGKGTPDKKAKPDKPELTKPMQNYFGLHRHAAVRLELLNHPQLALRLAVAHMVAGSRLWQVRSDPQRADKPEIEASVMQSKAQQAFAEKRQSVCDLLGLDPDRSELVRPNGDDFQTVAVFVQLLKLTDDEVMHVLAFAMAETLEAGTAAAIPHQSTEMLSRFQISVLGASALGLAFLAVKPLADPSPIIVWNASESVPIGWYYVSKRQPGNGEIAVIKPSEWVQMYAAQRGYLPSNVWLLKPIFASHPSVICRFGEHVLVDGKLVAKARHFDKKRRLLPSWKGCEMLKPGEVFVLGKHRDSFDGRYFGAVNRDQVTGTAISFNSYFK